MGVETTLRASRLAATSAMTDDNRCTFSLPSVSRKKVTAAFDGGRLSSDSGVMLLALADRRRKVSDTLAALIADRRDPSHITHTVADVLRARMLAIGCGYPDGNDFDRLRFDPAFKLACGRLPDTGGDLCSQPTISRWENAPTLREIIRLTYALVDIWCRSHQKPPRSVVLDIDDTVDVVHGHQQLAQWNAHYDEPLLPADPCLRCGYGCSGCCDPAPRQDAVGCGGSQASQSPDRAHPLALAQHPHHHPRRRPLRPRRGDDVVRELRHRLHLRALRQCCARPPGRSCRRRYPGAPCREPG